MRMPIGLRFGLCVEHAGIRTPDPVLRRIVFFHLRTEHEQALSSVSDSGLTKQGVARIGVFFLGATQA